jgi:hypothetical protein
MKLLVDSAAWIDFFNPKINTPLKETLTDLLDGYNEIYSRRIGLRKVTSATASVS